MSDVMEKTKWLIHKVNLMGSKWADADDAKKNELWRDVHSANRELEDALLAAAKVRQKGERRIAYNGTGEEEYASVLMHEDETLKPGEELVIRPIGGKEQKSGE